MTVDELRRELAAVVDEHRGRLGTETVVDALDDEAERIQGQEGNRTLVDFEGSA